MSVTLGLHPSIVIKQQTGAVSNDSAPVDRSSVPNSEIFNAANADRLMFYWDCDTPDGGSTLSFQIWCYDCSCDAWFSLGTVATKQRLVLSNILVYKATLCYLQITANTGFVNGENVHVHAWGYSGPIS